MNEIVLNNEEATRISKIEQWASTLNICSVHDHDTALNAVKEIKAMIGKVKDFFGPSKTAAAAAHKAICANEASFLNRLTSAEAIAKRAILTYQQAEEDKRRKEQARLQAIADEQARKEREKLQKQMEKAQASGKTEKAEMLAEKAAQVEAPIVAVSAPVLATGGTITKRWKAQLVSMHDLTVAAPGNDLAMSFLLFDQTKADALARSLKGAVSVPGVRFYEDAGLSVRK